MKRTTGGPGRTTSSPASRCHDAPWCARSTTRPALTALLVSGGFGDVRVDVERHDVVLADEEEWWAWKWSYSLRGMLEQVDAATIDTLREQAFARLRAQRGDDGLPLRLTALLATGRA